MDKEMTHLELEQAAWDKLSTEWSKEEKEAFREGWIRSIESETECDRFEAELQYDVHYLNQGGIEVHDEKLRFKRQEVTRGA